MSKQSGLRVERRRTLRLSPKGTVILHGGEQVTRGRISNLGGGGMLVTTEATATESLLTRSIEIELRLDGGEDEWLRVTGRVRRSGGGTLAFEFEAVPPSFVRLVDDTATASHRHVRVLSVVVVDATADRRVAIADAFRTSGCAVIDTSTPLEAIVRLGEAQFEPDLIVIADSIPSATSQELRHFVERAHPAATLITVGDELVEPAGLQHWLSSANVDGDLVARVRELLSRPARTP
jgi:hypothetical protein